MDCGWRHPYSPDRRGGYYREQAGREESARGGNRAPGDSQCFGDSSDAGAVARGAGSACHRAGLQGVSDLRAHQRIRAALV